ncbi:ABC transporter permease [Vibrio methylphosphonaticus]|uniref:ABC transporter permease n=1 Tax=Vibrio methylphosphonaticus TaxID=2946866 RepID=UPI00202AA557|nr:thiamine ABC transporter permease [Vibrio methylphosphonaticus]MCL9775807.1 thiamine ABC transporter permease [Vibrio methylphosphonaticus]
MLRLLYGLLVVVCILPTIPGLLGVGVASLGYIPPLSLHAFSLDGFSQVFSWQGVETSLMLTLFTTLASSYLACVLTFFILESCWNRPIWNKIELALSPLLAMPHVAFAIGFAFLFAPTGFGIRVLSEFFNISQNTGVDSRALLIKDPYGVGLTLMLALKEVPFLLLMSIPILKQLRVRETIKVASALGYRHHVTWWKVIMPQWFNKMRFPMLAVIAYSLSVVDVALVLGPTNPPTFAVLVWQWFNDPDLQLLPRASAGAVILFLVASLLIMLARFIEHAICRSAKQWQYSGRWAPRLPGKAMILTLIALFLVMLPLIVTWTFALRWRFPDSLPSRYTLRFWEYEWHGVLEVLSQSLFIALISATIALVFAIIGHEYRLRYRWQVPGYVIAIPMLIPQLSILFGLQVATLVISNGHYTFWVCWSHVFFAFPYIYLSLDGPWRSYNEKLTQVSLSLGKSPINTWLHVKLPQLLPAIIFAWAVGISVSLAQYLPTLILGAGRVSTITTEAVALSSGFDRRVTAIYALFQALLPLLFFTLAVMVSRLNTRHRYKRVKGLIPNESFSRKPRHP